MGPLLADTKDELKEHFVCLYLNVRHEVIAKKVIPVSSFFGIDCSPSLGVSGRGSHSSASLIVARIHPSGDVTALMIFRGQNDL